MRSFPRRLKRISQFASAAVLAVVVSGCASQFGLSRGTGRIAITKLPTAGLVYIAEPNEFDTRIAPFLSGTPKTVAERLSGSSASAFFADGAVIRFAPGNYRAVAALQHLDAFYEAFGIREGDPMWLSPEKRVHAW